MSYGHKNKKQTSKQTNNAVGCVLKGGRGAVRWGESPEPGMWDMQDKARVAAGWKHGKQGGIKEMK